MSTFHDDFATALYRDAIDAYAQATEWQLATEESLAALKSTSKYQLSRIRSITADMVTVCFTHRVSGRAKSGYHYRLSGILLKRYAAAVHDAIRFQPWYVSSYPSYDSRSPKVTVHCNPLMPLPQSDIFNKLCPMEVLLTQSEPPKKDTNNEQQMERTA